MAAFAALLRAYRQQAGLSQRGLASASGVNPAIISRMESGGRGASGPAQVMALARALRLDAAQADALLASAGFWPAVFLALGPQDETLLSVARVLTDPRVSLAARDRLRRVVALLAEQWVAAAEAVAHEFAQKGGE